MESSVVCLKRGCTKPNDARKKTQNFTIYLESLMEDKPMQLSETEKRRLQFLIQDRPTQISENSRRYAKAIARKMLDERAARRKAES